MKKSLEGLRLALCQMKVVPGRPDLNAAYIIEEIKEAAKRGMDIIIFPEMSTTGYFIGDMYEDEAFLRDIEHWNREIRDATKCGIAAVVGTAVLQPDRKGEDGYQRILNTAVLYANGRYICHRAKTLQPNYRIFDDDRHFFSSRKIAFEEEKKFTELIKPFLLTLRSGQKINLGLMLCEDMWHEYYPLNPAEILAENGADIICNLSASPWTWQKNRKRHQIVKELSKTCKIPLVYVNNTGIQNTGKNIIIFDGRSALYGARGQAVYEAPAYEEGTHDVILAKNMPALQEASEDDAKELYQAVRCAVKEFFGALAPGRRKIVVGLSGGIDSSLSAALYADIIGKENVVGINMPSKFNSKKTQELARVLASNLGIAYEVRPIQNIVDSIAASAGIEESAPTYENVQARARMEILAARAQELNCVFSANWNKVEAAFGYGTLYGDMAGAIAVLGDLLKREVYQLADYLNREVFKREVIPQECFDIKPTAELRLNQQDPFDYGNLKRRGYHEEMVRAFVEFRRNPEWFLEMYKKGELEREMKLETGRLEELFKTPRHFIHDLEKHWRIFFGSYFKRIQGPPVPIVSKRAFGTDLRESMMPPHFNGRYFDLRAEILSRDVRRVAIYGGSFNPPSLHHRQIAMELLWWFDEVFVIPCGPRYEKDSLKLVLPNYRKEMALLNFGDLPRVSIDASDLDSGVFTPAYVLDEKYKTIHQDKEIWHVIGGDLISGGAKDESEIQKSWKKGEEIWRVLNFAIVARPGFNFLPEDFPPRSEIIEVEELVGSSTLIRDAISEGKDSSFLLLPAVYAYIKKLGIYQSSKGGS